MIHAAGMLSEEEHREASLSKRALEDLVAVTGGESYFPSELAEVDRIAYRVARDIRNQYVISTAPAIRRCIPATGTSGSW
jgi:hypothetical protein